MVLIQCNIKAILSPLVTYSVLHMAVKLIQYYVRLLTIIYHLCKCRGKDRLLPTMQVFFLNFNGGITPHLTLLSYSIDDMITKCLEVVF